MIIPALLALFICTGTCDPNPCKNHGRCELTEFGRYYCVCFDGYSGVHCTETGVATPCYPNPCKNRGDCFMDNKKYRGYWYCKCRGGYSGKYCTRPHPHCNPNPCKNGGWCSVYTRFSYYNCRCYGYLSKNCTILYRPCHPNPCKNGGSCFIATGEIWCMCISGYHGQYCDRPDPPCNPNPCQFGGECGTYWRTGLHYCDCKLGHTGYNCQESIHGSQEEYTDYGP